MSVRTALIALTSIGLGACSADAPVGNAVATIEKPLNWQNAAGGGSVAFASPAHNGSGEIVTSRAYRCWPRGSEFDCLAVFSLKSEGYAELSAQRFVAAKLPVSEAATSAFIPSPGYACRLAPRNDYFDETISGPTGATLASNRVISISQVRPWGADYVQRFMRDNKLPGAPHFECEPLLRLLSDNSLETLATTSVTHQIMQ